MCVYACVRAVCVYPWRIFYGEKQRTENMRVGGPGEQIAAHTRPGISNFELYCRFRFHSSGRLLLQTSYLLHVQHLAILAHDEAKLPSLVFLLGSKDAGPERFGEELIRGIIWRCRRTSGAMHSPFVDLQWPRWVKENTLFTYSRRQTV